MFKNFTLQFLSIRGQSHISPLINQNFNIEIISSSFNKFFSPLILSNNHFSSKYSRIVFQNALTSFLYLDSNQFYGTIYSSLPIPQKSEYFDCGFINISYGATYFIKYSQSSGSFKMERCSFFRVKSTVTLAATVIVEPCNVVSYKANCFQDVFAHVITFSSGWSNQNINSLYCSQVTLQDSGYGHTFLILGKSSYTCSEVNTSLNQHSGGQWYHNSILASAFTQYHTIYKNNNTYSYGSNVKAPINIRYINIIENQNQMCLLYSHNSYSAIATLHYVYVSKLCVLYNSFVTLKGTNIFLDSSFSTTSIPSICTIINPFNDHDLSFVPQTLCFIDYNPVHASKSMGIGRNYWIFLSFHVHLIAGSF